MHVYCKNCGLQEECPHNMYIDGYSQVECDDYQSQRYFELAGIRHIGNDGIYRLNSDYEMLEQENAKLKAREANTRLGLEKMEKLIHLKGPGDHDQNYLDYQDGEWHIFRWDGEGLACGATLADLIDKVALMEVE